MPIYCIFCTPSFLRSIFVSSIFHFFQRLVARLHTASPQPLRSRCLLIQLYLYRHGPRPVRMHVNVEESQAYFCSGLRHTPTRVQNSTSFNGSREVHMPLASLVCSAPRPFFLADTRRLKRGCGPRSLASLGGLNMQVTAILASVVVETGPMSLPHIHACASDPFRHCL